MKRAATSLAIAVLLLVAAPPVTAGAPSNCSFRLEPVSQDGATTTATAVLIGCYTTYEAAVEAGYGGAMDAPTGATPTTLTLSQLQETTTSVLNDTLIGTEYIYVGYVGDSVSYFAPSTCSASQIWELNYVGDKWNDDFESGKGFGGCDTNKKFEHADFGGAVLTCTPNCSGYGTLNNRVSSLRWKP